MILFFLNDLLLKIAAGQGHCLIGGDFNLVFNPTMDHSLPKSPTPTKAAMILNHDIKDLGLCDVWRTLNPNKKDFSFYSNVHKFYSRIDMFWAPQQIISRIKDCTYLAAAVSDHNPIKMTLLIDPKFITYMTTQIDLFPETNMNSAFNAIIWKALKAFMRGCNLSYSTYKSRERRQELNKKHWLNELSSYCTPEKILYNVRRKPEIHIRIWGSFLALLHSINPLS